VAIRTRLDKEIALFTAMAAASLVKDKRVNNTFTGSGLALTHMR